VTSTSDPSTADSDDTASGAASSSGDGVAGPEQRGLRAAGQLGLRTVIMRGITLVGMIALARLLTPADFGTFAVVQLIVTIITVVGDLGIGSALVQQREEPLARELQTVFAVQLLLFIGLATLAILTAPLVVAALGLGPGALQLAVLMAATLAFVPLRGIPVIILSRTLRFGPLAAVEIAQQTVFFGIAIACAVAGIGVVSFGIAALAQSIVGTVLFLAIWHRRLPRPGFDRRIAVRLWRFGIRMQAANLAVWGRDALVPLFGGIAGGVTAVGYLQFAWRNGQLVTGLDEVITRVGFPAMSRLQHDRDRFARASSNAMALGVLVSAGIQAWLIAVAPTLIPVVFSEQWTPAVRAFQFVALGAVAGTMTSVIRATLNGTGESGLAMRGAVAVLLLTAVLFPIGLVIGGVTGGGLAFAASSLLGLMYYVRVGKAYIAVPWPRILRICLLTALSALVGWMILMWRTDLLGLMVSGIAYVALVGVLAWFIERPLAIALLRVVRKGPAASGTGSPEAAVP
jgi:O-antigen/teichoic acid export membrane protein